MDCMGKKRKVIDIIRSKTPTQGPQGGGSLDYLPPSGGRYLVKNNDDTDDEPLVEMIRMIVQDIINHSS